MQSYSSNEVDHATESSHNPAFRQLLVEERDTEQFLKAIAPKYLGVYVVDRRTDLFRDILGPDYFRRIVQDKGGRFFRGPQGLCLQLCDGGGSQRHRLCA